jgi:NAD(P)-dependent dehydrogenase (short-subunit alcohol dehydrogenase family)
VADGGLRTLKHRVVVITGASRGIGHDIAVRAASDGASVREEGVDDLSQYRLAAREEDLTPNFYLPSTPRPDL